MRRPNVRVEARRLPPNASRQERDRSIQQLLRVFKRACNEANVMGDFKEHEHFTRPTDKKRRKRMAKVRGALLAQENAAKAKDQERERS